MDTVFILTFSWHSLLQIPGPALFKVLYQTALRHFSLLFPDCPCVLVTSLAFKVKATHYLQLHKYLIVECITWGMTMEYEFFCLNLSERSTEIQHYGSTGQTGPVLHQGWMYTVIHNSTWAEWNRLRLHFLCGNYCLKQENIPRGAWMTADKKPTDMENWILLFCNIMDICKWRYQEHKYSGGWGCLED